MLLSANHLDRLVDHWEAVSLHPVSAQRDQALVLGALCHGWIGLVQAIMDGFEGLDLVVLGSEAMFFHGTEHGAGIDRAIREMTVAVHGQMFETGARPADNTAAE